MRDSVPRDGLQEDEIDLREYVRVIVRHAWMIVGLAVIAVIVTLAIGFFQPPTYEAKALVAITKPQFVMNFDPRMSAAPDVSTPSRALVSLATADDVLSAVLSSVSTHLPPRLQSVDGSRSVLAAGTTSDPTLVELKARAGDPQQAATLANTWAEVLADRARAIYGQSQGDVSSFEAWLAEADARLTKAEAALAQFQARSELNVLNNQLNALRKDQQSYLSERDAITRLIADIGGFRGQLGKYAPDAHVAPSDDLIALLLETRAFSAGMMASSDSTSTSSAGTSASNGGTTAPIQLQVFNTGAASPIQLQVSAGEAFTNKKAGELQKALDDLAASLRVKSSAIEARVDESTPRSLKLQGAVQRLQNEADRLALERDVTREAYQTLARKTEETRIAAQGTNGQIRIASQALPPSGPLSSNKTRDATVAGFLALLVGLAVAFARDWWRRGTQTAGQELASPQPLPEAAIRS